LSIQITRLVCQGRCAWRLTVSIARHADLAILLSLVDLDRCGAGCFRIGIPILRGELPSDIMTKRVRIQNRIARLLPREGTLDLCAGIGILHLARNFALAQCIAVGDLGCGDFAVRRGLDPVHRVEDERQFKVLVVGGGDLHLDGSDLAGRCSIFRIEPYQSQLAALKFHYLRVDIISMSGEANSSLPIPQIVVHGAVISIGRFGQQLLEVIGVRQMGAVDHAQRAMLDIRGCGSLIDGEVPAYRRDDVVAAFNVLDGHPAGTGVGVVGILYRVFSLRNDHGPILEGHGRFQRIAGVGAGRDFNRGRHLSWRDFPLDRGLTGVVAGTFDGQGDAVIGIGGLVAAFDNIGDSCFIPVLQCHAGDPRRLLHRVVLEFVFFQRDGCALDGLGGDGDFHDAGHFRIGIPILRGELPSDIMTKRVRVQNRIARLLPREGTLDLCAGVGILHLAQNSTLAQRVAVGDLGCGDFAVRRGLDLVHRVEDERQLKVLVVGGGDLHLDGADLAGHVSIFRIELCQNQHAVFKLYDRFVVIISALANKGNSSLITIAYRTIFALGQFGQQLAEIVGVRLLCAVDHAQRAGRDIRGRSGFVNFERLIIQLRAVQRKGLFRRAVFKGIVRICQLDGEGDVLFCFACVGGIILGVGQLETVALRQRKRQSGLIACGACCAYKRNLAVGQIGRAVVSLDHVSDLDLRLVRNDSPFGGFRAGVVAAFDCLDGQRLGAYASRGSSAAGGVINAQFQRLAVVRYDEARRGSGGVIRLISAFVAAAEGDLGIA